MTMPNFLVIGAAKCGTDALCNYLGQHPDVYVSPSREPNFFVADGRPEIPYCGPGDRRGLQDMWVSSRAEYERLFSGVTAEKAIGEGTAWYIYYECAPARIRQYVPDAKLIAVLRNPIDRAYSAYTMLLRDGRETMSDFASALDAEDERTARNWEPIWHYVKMGFYTQQLRRYFDVFDAQHMRVIVYDDFNARPGEVVRDLYRFLEVEDSFEPDTSRRYNVSQVPRNLAIHKFVAGEHPVKSALKMMAPAGLRQALKRRVAGRNLTRPQPMDPAARRRLVEVFRPEVLQLQALLDRDLSGWLQ